MALQAVELRHFSACVALILSSRAVVPFLPQAWTAESPAVLKLPVLPSSQFFFLPLAGIVLTRAGYYTIPSMEELAKFTNDKNECIVTDFTIGRKGEHLQHFSLFTLEMVVFEAVESESEFHTSV